MCTILVSTQQRQFWWDLGIIFNFGLPKWLLNIGLSPRKDYKRCFFLSSDIFNISPQRMSTHSPWPFVYCSGVSEYTKSSSCPMMSRSGSILISHSQPKSDSFSAIPFSNLCGRVCRLTTPLPWYWVVYMMASGD